MKPILSKILAPALLALSFSASADGGARDNPVQIPCRVDPTDVDQLTPAESTPYSITQQQDALDIAQQAGVDSERVVMIDMVPFNRNGDDRFELVWGVAERMSPLGKAPVFLVTYIEPRTGGVLAQDVPHAGLRHFLIEKRFTRTRSEYKEAGIPQIEAVGVFSSFPWGYDLPFCSASYVSCGPGCGAHTGTIYWSYDWNLNGTKDCGNPALAAGSGWVMGTGWNGGYGNTVVISGGDAGSGRRYVQRSAHLQSIDVVPGWWVDKGRRIGGIGTTGNSTGCHQHMEIWRGTAKGVSISGGTLPIANWPRAGDSIDRYDGSIGRCFQSAASCSSGDTCP